MTEYRAPRIVAERLLSGLLECCSELPSDAEIKHGVHPLNGYEAPAITEQRALDGHLILVSGLDR